VADEKDRICPVCWARNPAGAAVCRACGAGMSGAAAAPAKDTAGPSSTPLPEATASQEAFATESDESPTPANLMWTSPEVGALLANRYRIVYEIARGGMGIVYLAEDSYLDNLRVAVKILPRQVPPDVNAEKRLKREALTAMALSHDNIMRLFSFDQDKGQSFLVMEYINGPTLDDLLASRGRLTPAEVGLFLRPVCEALQYAHDKGVVHRDIKPANVMLQLPEDSPFRSGKSRNPSTVSPNTATVTVTVKPGSVPETPPEPTEMARPELSQFSYDDALKAKVKLCDFGIAQQLRQTMTRLTGTSIIGSPIYMSPEQLQGGKIDHRTDIYALGTAVFELLSGQVPFDGPIHGLTYQIIEKEAPSVPGVDQAISDVVLKCLSKEPRDRWQSCVEFADALEDALAGKAGGEYSPEKATRRKPLKGKGEAPLSSTSAQRGRSDATKKTDRRVADLRVAKMSFEARLFDKSLSEMKQYRLLHGDSDELLTFAAECVDKLVNMRDYSQAHEFCQFVVLIDQENPNVYLTLGRVQRVLGRTEDAERSLRLAMIYGADEKAVEKELRGTLTELRETSVHGGLRGPVQMTAARIAGYVGALIPAIGVTMGAAYYAGVIFVGYGQIAACAAVGIILMVLSGAAGIVLTTVFAGKFEGARTRMTKARQYLAHHGYAGGWLGIAVVGLVASMAVRWLLGESWDWQVFLLVFGFTIWAASILYSWYVVYSALSQRPSSNLP